MGLHTMISTQKLLFVYSQSPVKISSSKVLLSVVLLSLRVLPSYTKFLVSPRFFVTTLHSSHCPSPSQYPRNGRCRLSNPKNGVRLIFLLPSCIGNSVPVTNGVNRRTGKSKSSKRQISTEFGGLDIVLSTGYVLCGE